MMNAPGYRCSFPRRQVRARRPIPATWRGAGLGGLAGPDDSQGTVTDPALVAQLVAAGFPEGLLTGPFTKNGHDRTAALIAKGVNPKTAYVQAGMRSDIDQTAFMVSLNGGVPPADLLAAVSGGLMKGGSEPRNVSVPWLDAAGNLIPNQIPAAAPPPAAGVSQELLDRSILSPLNNPVRPAAPAAPLAGLGLNPWMLAAGGLAAAFLFLRR